MDEKTIASFISDNALTGALSGGALAFLYKIWRILKKDRKEDNLDEVERALRDEMRNDIKTLKEENKTLKEENQRLHQELSELKASFRLCQTNHPVVCPIFGGHQIRRESDAPE